MEIDDMMEIGIENSLPDASRSDLQGKQSVRATFKLTKKTIDAVSMVAAHLGIKQKSLFDHLIEDITALCSIATECRYTDLKQAHRVQKTYVISRKSLYSLDRVSKDYNAPRDALIEHSVRRLLPIIQKEKEKHKIRKEILRELVGFFKEGKRILIKSKALLGKDDPVYTMLEPVMLGCENAFRKVELFIKKGDLIERF